MTLEDVHTVRLTYSGAQAALEAFRAVEHLPTSSPSDFFAVEIDFDTATIAILGRGEVVRSLMSAQMPRLTPAARSM